MNITKKQKKKILSTLNKFRIVNEDDPVNGCYGWSGSVKRKNTSPRVSINGVSVGAHRAAWMAENGKIPENKYIHRTCDNRICTNPAHLLISSDRCKASKSMKKFTNRLGRERLSVDLPSNIVRGLRKMASRYNLTLTKYLYKRLFAVLMHENRINERS